MFDAFRRLDGGDPTLRDGFRIAMSHLPQIIGYALIAATVGMVLRFISERAGLVGQIIAGVIGFAWSVATFLVVLVVGALALVGAAASGIYTASLYRYATNGDPGSNFRAETMSSAFRSTAGGAPGFGQPR